MTQSDIERKERGGSSGKPWLWIVVGVLVLVLLVWWFWPDTDDTGNTDVESNETQPVTEEMGSEPNLDDETQTTTSVDTNEPAPAVDDMGSESTLDDEEGAATSSDRTVAVPATPGIATQDPENGETTDGDDTTATSADEVEVLPVSEILDDPEGWSGREVNGIAQVDSMATDQTFWIIDGDVRLLALIVSNGSQRMTIESGQQLQVSDAQIHSLQDVDQDMPDQLDDDTQQLLNDQQVVLVISEDNISIQ